jgi:hypothetical protein
MKAARPGAARIQIEHSRIEVPFHLMCVAANDGVEAGSLRFEIKIVEIMEQIEMEARNLYNRGQRQFLRPRLGVHVAAHSKNRRDGLESRENFRSADVSRMNDEIGTIQSALRFRAKQPVSIGNDADPHGNIAEILVLVRVLVFLRNIVLWELVGNDFGNVGVSCVFYA